MPIQPIPGKLELLAKQVVEGFIIGLHKSPFHGFSVEFAEHRLYNPGDNLRYIDWKVYGRKDKMFVKKFEEETNLRCCIAIDTSSSMLFDNGGLSKLQYACVSAASLMLLLKRQLDACGLLLFDERIHWKSPIKSTPRHYKMLMTELERLLLHKTEKKSTELAASLHQIADTLHQRSLVLVFSDYLTDPEQEADFYDALQHLKHNKHEVVIFQIGEGQKEWDFSFENRPIEFVDLESGEKVKLQPNEYRDTYASAIQAFHQRLQQNCLKYHIDLVSCDINEPYESVLQRYLLKRNKMM